jgi:voltage-gated potassium channel Kch
VQYGTILQGSIADIQTAQSQINTLANCWIVTASSTAVTNSQAATASANAASALNLLKSFNPQVDSINNSITGVNNEIAMLQQLQSEALSVASAADVSVLTSDYNAAQSTQTFISQNDVTNAQQNRTTLQAQMASLNASTAASLAQCKAFGK